MICTKITAHLPTHLNIAETHGKYQLNYCSLNRSFVHSVVCLFVCTLDRFTRIHAHLIYQQTNKPTEQSINAYASVVKKCVKLKWTLIYIDCPSVQKKSRNLLGRNLCVSIDRWSSFCFAVFMRKKIEGEKTFVILCWRFNKSIKLTWNSIKHPSNHNCELCVRACVCSTCACGLLLQLNLKKQRGREREKNVL